MTFELNTEQDLLRTTVRELLASSGGNDARLAATATDRGWDLQRWKQLAELGLLGLPFADEYGGAGAGPVETMVLMKELGRALAPEPFLDAVLLPGGLIASGGSEAQRSRILPALTRGETLLAFAHAEKGSRWTDTSVSTTASLQGDSWRISGRKNPVLQGHAADTLVVSATLPTGGTGLFLVETSDPGVQRISYSTHDQRRGAQIQFDDVAAEALGSGGAAGDLIDAAHARAQIALSAEAVGAMEEALRLTTEYLKQRKQFGAPLAQFQALTHRAADMYVLLELATSLTLYATASLSDGATDPVIASRAKLQVGRSARFIGQQAIQMHGGVGITAEYPVGHYLSRLTAIEHTLGSGDDHLSVLMAATADRFRSSQPTPIGEALAI